VTTPSMGRRHFLRKAIGAGGALGLGTFGFAGRPNPPAPAPGLKTASRTSAALGSRVTMTALHASERDARRAIDAAFAELDLVEDVMSLYRPGSQLRRLNREGRLDRPHPHLVEVLTAAGRAARRTGGAFDVTVQPLWELYARSHDEGRLPEPRDIARERRKVDHRRLEVGPRRIALRGEGMAVTLNSIAQGFAADRAAAVLRELERFTPALHTSRLVGTSPGCPAR
jgi:thiamine biosynthesis lipoprotein